MLSETFATDSDATADPIDAGCASVSANFTGTVLPSLKMLEPSGLIGCNTPPNMYCTCVVQGSVVEWPTLSVAVRSTVCGPTAEVSIGTVPLGSVARPDSPSEAETVACTPAACSSTADGQVTLRVGSVASTCTVSDAEPDSLPTASLTVAVVRCEPLVS